MENSPLVVKEKYLTKQEIEKLFPLVNKKNDYKIELNSIQLVNKIIELWFDTQGYDFWDNPYPEVIEWELTPQKEIIFKYGICSKKL